MTSGPSRVIFESKNDETPSSAGALGVAGDDPSTDESSVILLRKLVSIVEKSDSLPELSESAEDEPETDLISGAVRAWTFVVEMSSVGREIMFRLIVPGAYLAVPDRVKPTSSRLMRLVKARANDIAKVVELTVESK